jgi:putative FmdB family regulatory protein
MPLYDYRCHQCGETFEVRQKFADEVLTVHEGCGGALERLISLPALQFKGTGWYVTDYGRNGKTPAAHPNGKTESKSDSHGESKSDSKA